MLFYFIYILRQIAKVAEGVNLCRMGLLYTLTPGLKLYRTVLISNHPKLTGGVWNLFKQDYDGRLWDVLWMAYANAANNPQKSILKYEVILPHYELMQNADGIEKHMLKYKATLKVIVNGGDNGEPVITIMLPDED